MWALERRHLRYQTQARSATYKPRNMNVWFPLVLILNYYFRNIINTRTDLSYISARLMFLFLKDLLLLLLFGFWVCSCSWKICYCSLWVLSLFIQWASQGLSHLVSCILFCWAYCHLFYCQEHCSFASFMCYHFIFEDILQALISNLEHSLSAREISHRSSTRLNRTEKKICIIWWYLYLFSFVIEVFLAYHLSHFGQDQVKLFCILLFLNMIILIDINSRIMFSLWHDNSVWFLLLSSFDL